MWRIILFIVSSTTCVTIVEAEVALILDPPMTQEIEINMTATFTCRAIATFITYEVNGQPITAEQRNNGFDDSASLVTIDQATNLRSRSLTVLGTFENNGSTIACSAVLQSSPPSAFISDPVIIHVIVPEDPPESVTITFVSIIDTTLHLSWTRPEGTVLFYNITTNYTITGASETLSVEGNVTMLFYTLSVVHPDLNNITISIVAINAAGAGPPTTILHLLPTPINIISSTPAPELVATSSISPDPVTSSSSPSMSPLTPTTSGGINLNTAIVLILVLIVVVLSFTVLLTVIIIASLMRRRRSFDLHSKKTDHDSHGFSNEPVSRSEMNFRKQMAFHNQPALSSPTLESNPAQRLSFRQRPVPSSFPTLNQQSIPPFPQLSDPAMD